MAAEQDKILGAIRPTLFIGLGGTGKEVLLRLRRKFYERLGRPGLPCTAYLWIDTDTRDVMAQGEAVDELYQAVTFEPHEEIGLLGGSVGDDLAGMFTNQDQWKHIHKWLYPEVERYGAEISDGAGGVRAVGRLTFFYHFGNSISVRVRDALTNVGTQEKINETLQLFKDRRMKTPEFPPVPIPQVFIVTSVAGGTGCGTFLDTAFFLRYLSQRGGIPIERYVGILFMPNVFYSNAQGEVAQRSYANAYAALKELEFYTLRLSNEQEMAIDYHVEWERDRIERIQGPPFSIAYIEEMKNEGGIPLEPRNRSEVFGMVAESLFLDFMPGPFSTKKRSHYSNVAQYLSSPQGANISSSGIVLPQAFARRYASFGMSKIEIPIDALKGACAAKLGSEVVEYILRESSDPNIKTNVLDDMAHYRLDSQGLVDRYGTAWKESIRAAVATVFRGLVIREARQIDELETRLKDLEDKQIRSDGTDPAKWGAVIDLIKKTTGSVNRDACNALLEWVKENCLEKDSRGLRILLTQDGYLRYMSENLKELYLPPREGVRAIYDVSKETSQKDADYYKKRKETVLKELRFAIKSLALAGLKAKDSTIQTLVERLRESQEQYALAKAADCLYDETKKVAKSAVEFIAEKKPLLERFQEAIASVRRSFDTRYEGFTTFGDHVLFVRFFDHERDWGEFYKLDVDEQGQPKVVDARAEYRRFLEQTLGGKATLWELVELFDRKGEKETRTKLSNSCERRFWLDFEANPREVDVLQHPKMRSDWNASIERMVRSAMPMVRRESHLAGHALQVQRKAYLGVCQTEGEPYEGFIEDVRGRLNSLGYRIDDIEAWPTEKPWEVYLYLVAYAFPLSSLPAVVTDCHRAYSDFYKALRENQIRERKYQIPLHLSRTWEGKFEDLVVYSDEVAKRVKEAREILLFGGILKALTLREEKGMIEYGYKIGAPVFRTTWLGPKLESTDRLCHDQTLSARLLGAIQEREPALSKAQLKAYYWILQYIKFSGEIAAGSPEATLIDAHIGAVYDRLTAQGIVEESLSLDGIPEDNKAASAIANAGTNSVEWVGAVPTVKGLEAWTKPTGEGAA